jgi:hypothetical protein
VAQVAECVCADGCGSADECERAGLCLGSDEGVAYQEAHMREFFEWLFTDPKDVQ